MTQNEKELVDALDKTRETLAFLVFLTIRHHPDREAAEAINNVITTAKMLVAKNRGTWFPVVYPEGTEK